MKLKKNVLLHHAAINWGSSLIYSVWSRSNFYETDSRVSVEDTLLFLSGGLWKHCLQTGL